jgi:hypothetical protein
MDGSEQRPDLELAFKELETSLDDMIEICESTSIPYTVIEVRSHATSYFSNCRHRCLHDGDELAESCSLFLSLNFLM